MALLVYKPFTANFDTSPSPVLLRKYLPERTVPRRTRYIRTLSSPLELLRDAPSWSRSILDAPSRPRPTSSILDVPSLPRHTSLLCKTPTSFRWWKREIPLCTPDDLLEIIREPVGYYALPTDPYNEVYPGIFLSDGPTALCTSMLKRMGVTHVLNAAQGKERPNQVNTWPGFYTYSGIRFLGVEAFDCITFRLYPYFDEAAEFMEEALESGGKVLVHCRAGISRSATLVCAFLMIKRLLSAQEAVRTVRKHRAIIPNDGFLQQLCDLNDRLQKEKKR